MNYNKSILAGVEVCPAGCILKILALFVTKKKKKKHMHEISSGLFRETAISIRNALNQLFIPD